MRFLNNHGHRWRNRSVRKDSARWSGEAMEVMLNEKVLADKPEQQETKEHQEACWRWQGDGCANRQVPWGKGSPTWEMLPASHQQQCSSVYTLTLKVIVHVNPVLVITQLTNEVIKDWSLRALCIRNSLEWLLQPVTIAWYHFTNLWHQTGK